MASQTDLQTVETVSAETRLDDGAGTGNNYRVVLYNCDCHSQDEVILQLIKATGCDAPSAIVIMLDAELRGRAICFRGERADCHRVTRVLREIRLQCEVDCD